MPFRDINPAPLNPLAYGEMVGNIGTNILAGEERGMRDALLMDRIGRDVATRKALAGYFEAPEAERGARLNDLVAADPKTAASVLEIQAMRREIEMAQRKEQALKEYAAANAVLKSDKPALALRLLDSDGTFLKQLHDAGLIDSSDGISDDEARIVAEWARDQTAPIAGVTLERPDSPFAKINPADYTPESVAAFQASGGRDFSVLVPQDGAAQSAIGNVDPSKFTPESIAAFLRGGNDYSLLEPIQGGDGEAFDNAAKLRGEFNSQSSTFRAVTDGYRNVLSAASSPSAAGDIALLYAVMKMNDPTSSVREGEFATAQNAGSVPERVRSQYNKLLSGETLTAEQRADFVSTAGRIYKGQVQNYDRLRSRYEALAIRAGVDPADVIGETHAIDVPGANGGSALQVGTVDEGFVYIGGNPNDQSSWVRVR